MDFHGTVVTIISVHRVLGTAVQCFPIGSPGVGAATLFVATLFVATLFVAALLRAS